MSGMLREPQHERKISMITNAPFRSFASSGHALSTVEGLDGIFQERAKKFQSWVSTFSVFGGRF